jgi:excisionase family DNA binding protein
MDPDEAKLDLAGWITVKQASQIFGYNEEYIRRLLRNGMVRYQKIGRTFLLWQKSLSAYQRKMDKLGARKFTPHSAS